MLPKHLAWVFNNIFLLQLNPTDGASYKIALDAIRNPVDACEDLYEKIMILTKQISELGEAESKGKKHISKNIKNR